MMGAHPAYIEWLEQGAKNSHNFDSKEKAAFKGLLVESKAKRLVDGRDYQRILKIYEERSR